ncbi:FAD-dependent oxidoreductase [Bradyrhizobium sp. GCM10027634]|uniref:FAD-dependent oxidoreductase n=1 Tax=unclassified Bradyrhizobium TaxID=2631580 RepID=UPI00263AD152|nr:SidA/IucD/PvdA family monooxygenase [Bradyrhizobium sp. WYCCWR 12677]MDN5001392.1 FAD-dependent oxidoreductase [Bradyrhizobium sp. WYCCWR 12677]
MARSSTLVDVAVIGAGPYGLSLAAHLRRCAVEHRIFGEPMGSWKTNMPPGMLLKSYPWATSLSDPDSEFNLKRFCVERALPYHDELMPLPLSRFVDYGAAFQLRYVPAVERKSLIDLEPVPGFLRATFDDGEVVQARRVVVSIGLTPFKRLPPEAALLPEHLCSHSSEYGSLDGLDGRKVVVVGSGSSASELAALIHERGITVSLVARRPKLQFADGPRHRPWLLRALAPMSGIGHGWTLATCAKYPQLIQRLSNDLRIRLANHRALGPLGGAFVKDRVVGKIPTWLGHAIRGIETHKNSVILNLIDSSGAQRSMTADHIIFATGYKIDISRLRFLNPMLLERLQLIDSAPQLSAHYETTVPGLYFIGPAAANSFGPVCRFVYGTDHSARHLARHLSTVLTRYRPALQLKPLDRTVSP